MGKKKSTKRSESNSSIKKRTTRSSKKPKDLEHYRHSTIVSINSRVGKKAYKGIENLFDTQTWNHWFNDHQETLRGIIDEGLIPSIERIDSDDHYHPDNCIWLPLTVNVSLGKIHYYEEMADRMRKHVSKMIEWIPEDYREFYKLEYRLK